MILLWYSYWYYYSPQNKFVLSPVASIWLYLSIYLFVVLYRIFYSLSLFRCLWCSCLCSCVSSSFNHIYRFVSLLFWSFSCSSSSSSFDRIYQSVSLSCRIGPFLLSLCVVSILFLFVFFFFLLLWLLLPPTSSLLWLWNQYLIRFERTSLASRSFYHHHLFINHLVMYFIN